MDGEWHQHTKQPSTEQHPVQYLTAKKYCFNTVEALQGGLINLSWCLVDIKLLNCIFVFEGQEMRDITNTDEGGMDLLRSPVPVARGRRLGLGHRMISNRRLLLDKSSSKRRMDRMESSRSMGEDDGVSSPTRKLVKISRRRVRFEQDNKKRVIRHVRKIENCKFFEEEDVALRWWSKDELNEILVREQGIFEVFSNCCGSYIDSILQLWDHCKTSHEGFVLSKDDIIKIADAPARGMESDVVSTHIHGYREKAIKSVIETQRNMSRANPKIRANTMSRRYNHLSRASAMFARRIADGDAEVAAALYQ